MCEAGDMKKDKAQDLPEMFVAQWGVALRLGKVKTVTSSSRGQGPYQGKLLGGHGRALCQVEKRGNVPEGEEQHDPKLRYGDLPS